MIVLVSILSLCKKFFIINLKIMIVESTSSIFFPLAPLAQLLLLAFFALQEFIFWKLPTPPPPSPLSPTSSKNNGLSLN